MNIKVTRWSPDTCGCVIEYEWDADLPAESRTHTAHNIVTKCQAHNHHTNHHAHFSDLKQENVRKNVAHRLITEHVDHVTELDASGNKAVKEGKVSYFFDEKRNLKLVIEGATSKHKTNLKTALDNAFGKDKADII